MTEGWTDRKYSEILTERRGSTCALMTSLNGLLSRAGWIGGENDSSIPHVSQVLNLERLDTMYTPCPDSKKPVENDSRTESPLTISENCRLKIRNRPERNIRKVVAITCLNEPSIVSFISAYP